MNKYILKSYSIINNLIYILEKKIFTLNSTTTINQIIMKKSSLVHLKSNFSISFVLKKKYPFKARN